FTPVAEIDYTGEISVVGTGINKTIMLSGKGVLLPVIITSEQSLTFGRVAIGTPSTKKVKITVANLKENVQLVPSNNSFSVSPAVITKDLSGEQEVSITVTPKQSGDITADIDVMYAGQKVKTITSSAVGFQPTAIDFGTTTQLDFEAVAINSSKTLTFNVTPSHINGSVVNAVEGTDKDLFVVTPASLSSDKEGAEVTISVVFTPVAKTTYSAILVTTDTDGYRHEIQLSGKGDNPVGVHNELVSNSIPYAKDGILYVESTAGNIINIFT
ncbi:MAG: hypothetical protein RR220_00525, partial [Bacteroidaceae bacterium]